MAVSRRKFLKGAALAAGAAAMSSIVPAVQAKVDIPKKWDVAYDVVVIGYGGAGASAAITAHDSGSKVLILEKMSEGGGNTAVSSGGLFVPNDEKKGLQYTEKLFEYSMSDMDSNLVSLFVKEAMGIVDWVKTLKPDTEMKIYGHAGFAAVEGSECVDKWSVSTGPGGGGSNLWAVYSYAVETARKIPVMLNTSAKRLITNSNGEVIGVIAEADGKSIAIKAAKGVILTCGGYEYDEKMLKNFVKGYPIYAIGNPGNTGDGVKMALEAGADLWHMNGVSCPTGLKLPGYKAGTFFGFQAPGYILVDKTAKRFVNEKSIETHSGIHAVDFYDGHALMYPRIPCYAIFDEKARSEGGAVSGLSTSGYFRMKEKGGYKWTRSNQQEVDNGWIIKAPTIKELAAKLGLNQETLDATVQKWNTDVKGGGDTLFGREIMNKTDPSKAAFYDRYSKVLSAPVEEGPFYAIPVYPAIVNTQGGPRRDSEARILNPFGEPVKRLYGAGELGSLWGTVYQGGGNNAESIIFGRIAGVKAAALKPWG